MLFENLHQLYEVQQRSRETIHLVDHHTVDLTALDIGQQCLQRRSPSVASGEAAVVI